MRKMMNKKGFSLVELMIVVVIMGILIAVAIPLYSAITTNAENKTCANNIKVIKNTCSNYYASTDPQTAMPDLDTLESMMEAEDIPTCPVDAAKAYKIYVDNTGRCEVVCQNIDDTDHTLAKTGATEDGKTTDGYTILPQTKSATPET